MKSSRNPGPLVLDDLVSHFTSASRVPCTGRPCHVHPLLLALALALVGLLVMLVVQLDVFGAMSRWSRLSSAPSDARATASHWTALPSES